MGPCVAWYKGNESDRPPALWPGARNQFIRVLETPRFEDFDIVYEDEDDMFAYFGNGWSLEDDAEPQQDNTWYMGKPGKHVSEETIDRLRGTDPSVKEVLYGHRFMIELDLSGVSESAFFLCTSFHAHLIVAHCPRTLESNVSSPLARFDERPDLESHVRTGQKHKRPSTT